MHSNPSLKAERDEIISNNNNVVIVKLISKNLLPDIGIQDLPNEHNFIIIGLLVISQVAINLPQKSLLRHAYCLRHEIQAIQQFFRTRARPIKRNQGIFETVEYVP